MSIMRSRWLLVLLILLVAAGAAVIHFRNLQSNDGILLASGTIEATKVDVSFQIGGRVAEVTATEGHPVKAGDVLARLDPNELQAHVNQIMASLDVAAKQILQQKSTVDMRRDIVESTINQSQSQTEAAKISVDRLRNGSRPEEIRVEEALVTQAEADLERRKDDFQRISDLKQKDIVSRQEFDAAQSAYRMAETAVAAARERLALAREGSRREDLAEAEARLRAAQASGAVAEAGRKSITIEHQALDSLLAHQHELEAQLDAAKTQLTYTQIHAPLDGVVLTKNVESGEVVNPGTPVVSIANIDALWMNIYIPETQTGFVKLGQSVRVRVDSFPGEAFKGTISFVSSESEFTPKTIQTPEERIKLVYRVKVSLENTAQRLKPGMPADAEILLK
jgi:HlyD family secretion protein